MECFFVSDLHGIMSRYKKLFKQIKEEKPGALFIGGDIFPNFFAVSNEGYEDFTLDFLIPSFKKLKAELQDDYPHVFLILGNDDPKVEEPKILEGQELGLWNYIHEKKVELGQYSVFGYSNVPPTPFLFKDWERYDVSRFVDPGCVHPTEGSRSVDPGTDIEFTTIAKELEILINDQDLSKSIFLFHSPPYKTYLDRAALDGKTFEYVPLDVHVGSIAIQRFIEERQPMLTLHGHIHESSRITGHWKEQKGKTWMFSAAYEFPDLAIIKFDPGKLEDATRVVL